MPDIPECSGTATSILSHTKEQARPGFVCDFSQTVGFSSSSVENRSDCCEERVVPLLVEPTTEGVNFGQVIPREWPLETCPPHFARRSERLVRLVVPRGTLRHLDKVEVNP